MTWKQLTEMARADRLELHRTPGGVTIYTSDSFQVPFITITAGDLVESDSDRLLRGTTETALRLLKEMS